MHRFYVSPQSISDGEALITGPDAGQIQRVLRLGVGDSVCVFDGSGSEHHGEIISVAPSQIRLKIFSTHAPRTEAPLRITLAQSLLKGDKLDLVVQKCTEIGVASIIFFGSERTIPGPPRSKVIEKLARWRRIAKEAAEQSGRVRVPDITGPVSFPELLTRQGALGPVLVPWERETTPLSSVVGTLRETNPSVVTLVVGPEGGFSEGEIVEARGAGAVSVSLGPRILRAETAAIVATALVLSFFGAD